MLMWMMVGIMVGVLVVEMTIIVGVELVMVDRDGDG